MMWLLLAGGAFSIFLVVVTALVLRGGGGEFGFQKRIQVVDIEGELIDSRGFIDQLQRYDLISGTFPLSSLSSGRETQPDRSGSNTSGSKSDTRSKEQ